MGCNRYSLSKAKYHQIMSPLTSANYLKVDFVVESDVCGFPSAQFESPRNHPRPKFIHPFTAPQTREAGQRWELNAPISGRKCNARQV